MTGQKISDTKNIFVITIFIKDSKKPGEGSMMEKGEKRNTSRRESSISAGLEWFLDPPSGNGRRQRQKRIVGDSVERVATVG